MKLATVGRSDVAGVDGLNALYRQLREQLDSDPQLLVGYYTTGLGSDVHEAMSSLEHDAAVIGASSCQGVMTQDGVFGVDGNGVAIMGISDVDGDYGAAFQPFDGDPGQAGSKAMLAAMDQAGRPGELPDMILTHSSPGSEEAVIEAINKITGGHSPIVGGSAADNDLSGAWSMFANDSYGSDGVALAVIYSSSSVSTAFQSGYEPTPKTGKVTACDGRILQEIDGRPAAVVYNEWVGGVIDSAFGDPDNNVLADTTLQPLGREAGKLELNGAQVPYYTLIHPERVTDDKGLTLFADVEVGQTMILMEGTISSLIRRAGDVIMTAKAGMSDALGGFVVYCAGCRLAVDDDLGDVASRVNQTLDNQPFIGCFTFGEQGCLLGGQNKHGNLMISVGLFEQMP